MVNYIGFGKSYDILGYCGSVNACVTFTPI
jgi:hypothetical protein